MALHLLGVLIISHLVKLWLALLSTPFLANLYQTVSASSLSFDVNSNAYANHIDTKTFGYLCLHHSIGALSEGRAKVILNVEIEASYNRASSSIIVYDHQVDLTLLLDGSVVLYEHCDVK